MTNAIEAEGLVKRYGEVQAVDGVSFAVPEGTVFGLLGPNGAGKSTTVRILTTLTRADQGCARVAGLDVREDPTGVRRSIGVVGQKSGVDPEATGRENLRLQGQVYDLPAAEREQRVDDLLERFRLADAADRLVSGYSGGMQRRLDVALGLMSRPKVLFLDEPTTGLDPEVRAEMWHEIEALAREHGVTVLLTTHYMEEADRLCGRVAIIDHGQILTVDTPEALKGSLPGAHVLDLDARAQSALAPLLERIPGVARVEVMPDGAGDGYERLRLFVAPGDGLLDRVLHAVRDARGDLRHISLQAPSLEDVYVHLTGKELRE
jgi:ABC-2 type transport system ATP-binding protein